MNKKTKGIFIPLIVTLSILVVLEVISRIVLANVYNRDFDSSLIEEHKYGPTSGLKANASGTVWGKPFHTDDMGGRKASRSKKGKPKMLFIGDSVTEGVGIDDHSTFADRINDYNDSLDVRNISMIGWSSADYRNVVDTILSHQNDISHIYVFYCLNDIYGKHAAKDLPEMGNKKWIGAVSRFLQNNCGTYKLVKLILTQNSDSYFRYDEALYKDESMLKSTVADLMHIDSACSSKGVHFGVIMLPYRTQLQHSERDLPQRTLYKQMGKTFFVDVLNRIEVYGHDPGIQVDGDAKELYLFGDEIHFSAKGHKAITDLFSRN